MMSALQNHEIMYRIDRAMDVLVPRRTASPPPDTRILRADIGIAREEWRRGPGGRQDLRHAQRY